jgi:hypothetical protein
MGGGAMVGEWLTAEEQKRKKASFVVSGGDIEISAAHPFFVI